MYIKHISQIWIRLVQCFSIWTHSRSIRYRCGINSFFVYPITNNLEYSIIVDIHIQIAHFQRVVHVYKRSPSCVYSMHVM